MSARGNNEGLALEFAAKKKRCDSTPPKREHAAPLKDIPAVTLLGGTDPAGNLLTLRRLKHSEGAGLPSVQNCTLCLLGIALVLFREQLRAGSDSTACDARLFSKA